MKLKEKIDLLAEKRLDARFQKLVQKGLLARDVVPIKLDGEDKERLALLCTCKKDVYAVVCVGKKQAGIISPFELLGNFVQAKKGVVVSKKSEWVKLSGHYEGLNAPLIVAQDVTVKLSAKKQ